MTQYEHFTDVPAAGWRWASFSPRELACKGTGKLLVNEDALDKLQALRDRLRKPLILTSAYRSPEHNRRVSGAKASKHLEGIAFDVRMDNHDPWEFENAARAVGFTGFGFYPKSGFMHIDTGPAREWGTRWPDTPTAWPSEPPRQPETIREDRDTQVVAGASLAGAVALGVEHLPLASGLLGQLAPHAQLVAVVIGAILIGYFLWRRTR